MQIFQASCFVLPKPAKECIGEKSESISLNTNQAGTRNQSCYAAKAWPRDRRVATPIQSPIAFTGCRERCALLRHVSVHVMSINHSPAQLPSYCWLVVLGGIFGFIRNLMQAFLGNYTSRCVFGTGGRSCRLWEGWNAAGRADQEESRPNLKRAHQVVNLTTCSNGS